MGNGHMQAQKVCSGPWSCRENAHGLSVIEIVGVVMEGGRTEVAKARNGNCFQKGLEKSGDKGAGECHLCVCGWTQEGRAGVWGLTPSFIGCEVWEDSVGNRSSPVCH